MSKRIGGENMNIKVIKRFNDRITKVRRNVGDICEYSDARAKELMESGFAERAVAADAKVATPEKKG